jgi:hypothetical protein
LEENATQYENFEIEVTVESNTPEREEPWPDLRKAECPNCFHELVKIPGSKTKCPFCLKFMYVRSSPLTRTREVVTEQQVELIDDEWARRNGTWEERVLEKQQKSKRTD